MRDCVVSICKSLAAAEEELDDLDRGSGDGDCGSTLKAGATGQHLLVSIHDMYFKYCNNKEKNYMYMHLYILHVLCMYFYCNALVIFKSLN